MSSDITITVVGHIMCIIYGFILKYTVNIYGGNHVDIDDDDDGVDDGEIPNEEEEKSRQDIRLNLEEEIL